MANSTLVGNYKVTFSDGVSRDYRFSPEEIDDWVHESNQLFYAQRKGFEVMRVEDSKGRLAWPLPVRPWSRGREIALIAASCAYIVLAAYSIVLMVTIRWSVLLIPAAASYYFYHVALRFQRDKMRTMREEQRRQPPLLDQR